VNKKSVKTLAQGLGWWKYFTFLRKTDAWPSERREAYIRQQLQKTLVNAYEGTEFYRERFKSIGFDPRKDFSGPEVMSKLPLLTKHDIREHSEKMIDKRHLRGSVISETSGTTGQPLSMRLNLGYVALDYACMFRYWAQAGYRFRAPFAALRSFVPKQGEPFWKFDSKQNTLFLSAYHLSASTVEDYIKKLREFQPQFIRSYPSSLAVLAQFLLSSGQRLETVKGCFTASETLTPGERELIEAAFGKTLYDWYGMTEPVMVMTESKAHNGLNLHWEYGYPEFLQGEGLTGNERRLIATSLHNPVMPFIRYDTGDIAVLAEDEPSLQTLYPLRIAGMRGRKDESIMTPDGRSLPSINFYSVFRGATEVFRFQLVQYGLQEVTAKMQLVPGLSAAQCGPALAKLKTELEERLGKGIDLKLEVTDRFLTNADGKTPVIAKRPGRRVVETVDEYTISSQKSWQCFRESKPVLKLDWNEACGFVSQAAMQAVAEFAAHPEAYNWYPDAGLRDLTQAIAGFVGLPANCILPTHGSDMAMEYLAKSFVTAGDRVLILSPTYDNFRAILEQSGAKIESFEALDGNLAVNALLDAARKAPLRLVYLTNPNNPLGYHVKPECIRELAAGLRPLGAILIVDEAYIEFCGGGVSAEVAELPNVLVLRTFSKAFGLAGLRVGYILANPELLATVAKVHNPKHITMFAQVGALAALGEAEQMWAYTREVAAARAELQSSLEAAGWKVYASEANFLLLACDDPKGLLRHLEENGVLARDRTQYFAGKGHVRVTVGDHTSTRKLMSIFEQWPTARSR
jgi:histidinol-phosphate aminotransferase